MQNVQVYNKEYFSVEILQIFFVIRLHYNIYEYTNIIGHVNFLYLMYISS